MAAENLKYIKIENSYFKL